MFKHMLDVADDPDKLVKIAEKWDGTNLKDTLHPSKMLINDGEIDELEDDAGDGSSCCSYQSKTNKRRGSSMNNKNNKRRSSSRQIVNPK